MKNLLKTLVAMCAMSMATGVSAGLVTFESETFETNGCANLASGVLRIVSASSSGCVGGAGIFGNGNKHGSAFVNTQFDIGAETDW